ncbi:hypothetical protein FRB94_014514 [Tulasnella sp. JGI-2019a]|nr:hypothetical protein FRB94_014514 [Tulasnella sp. JGI-2019a]KAG9011672.1 hypothetical protein FRB93_002733 [Tulasnella sp. JGI-2019a]KAG9038760.1 hypothetical protein FRB95_014309 [Tulasnella sp. JGI-2019a]
MAPFDSLKITGPSSLRMQALEDVMNTQIFDAASSGTAGEVDRILKRFSRQRVRPSTRSIHAFLRGVGRRAGPEDLRHSEAIFRIRADESAWLILIDNALRWKEWGKAMNIYNEASNHLGPSSRLSQGLFKTCRYSFGRGRKTLGDIYDALWQIENDATDRRPLTAHPHILRDMLYSLAHANVGALNPKILKILREMRRHSRAFDARTLTELLLVLLQSRKTYSMMYAIYTNFVALGVKPGAATHTKILSYFLPPHDIRRYPPPAMFFSLLQSMSKDGYKPTLSTYRMYFNRIRLSMPIVDYNDDSTLVQNPNQRYLLHLRTAHTLFKASNLWIPDTVLLNVIMDGYSRSGGPHDAMEIWRDELWPSRRYSDTSISIILDVCGHHRQGEAAFKIWKALEAEERATPDRQITHKLWETWIENLCRLNLFDELLRVLVFDLGVPDQPRKERVPSWRVYLTKEMTNIPRRFHWKTGGVVKKRRLLDISREYGLPIGEVPEKAIDNNVGER